MSIALTLSVHCDREEEAVKAFEILGRSAAGLAFDGLYASVAIQKIEDDDE